MLVKNNQNDTNLNPSNCIQFILFPNQNKGAKMIKRLLIRLFIALVLWVLIGRLLSFLVYKFVMICQN